MENLARLGTSGANYDIGNQHCESHILQMQSAISVKTWMVYGPVDVFEETGFCLQCLVYEDSSAMVIIGWGILGYPRQYKPPAKELDRYHISCTKAKELLC
jgi:hypothetical protein